MPVSILLCEGQSKSPDVRLLRSILSGLACEIKPTGGKYGFGQRIIARQETNPNTVIKGIMDRDFDKDDKLPLAQPLEFTGDSGRIHFGWRWERCEIENYLIDPQVVELAVGERIHREAYEAALLNAAKSISIYTAARTALSISRKRFLPLENCWGHQSQLNHKFPIRFTENDCRQGILQTIQNYEDCQIVTPTEVFAHFESKLPACQPNGLRFKHFLTFFSGKDLILAMQPALEELGFTSPNVFRERVLFEVENSPEDVWNWLPEWTALRELILRTN